MEDQSVACSLLNTILGFEDSNKIVNVKYLNKELSSEHLFGRDFIVDILCETGNGERILVEMQNDFRIDYSTKIFVEFCRMIGNWDTQSIHQMAEEYQPKRVKSTHAVVEEFWKHINRAIAVAITNKAFNPTEMKTNFPDQSVMEPNIITTYRMKSDSSPERILGDLDTHVVLVMLANFTKNETELSTLRDQWLYAFKEEALSTGVKKIPLYKKIHNESNVGMNKDLGICHFYQRLNKTASDSNQLEVYERRIIEINRILESNEIEAFSAGKTEGKIEGKIEIARTMMQSGNFEDDTIHQIVGLSRDELSRIRTALSSQKEK